MSHVFTYVLCILFDSLSLKINTMFDKRDKFIFLMIWEKNFTQKLGTVPHAKQNCCGGWWLEYYIIRICFLISFSYFSAFTAFTTFTNFITLTTFTTSTHPHPLHNPPSLWFSFSKKSAFDQILPKKCVF